MTKQDILSALQTGGARKGVLPQPYCALTALDPPVVVGKDTYYIAGCALGMIAIGLYGPKRAFEIAADGIEPSTALMQHFRKAGPEYASALLSAATAFDGIAGEILVAGPYSEHHVDTVRERAVSAFAERFDRHCPSPDPIPT